MTELIVGIDFGTSNSKVVYYKGQGAREPQILQVSKVEPYDLLRSIVGYRKDQLDPDIGETVRANFTLYDNVIEDVKWQIAKGHQKTIKLTSGEEKSPIEVTAEIFKHIRSCLQEECDGAAVIRKVAIAVPDIFDAAARQNILAAARLGGFEAQSLEKNLIDEHIAVAEAFDTFGLRDGSHFLIFDFGASNLDLGFYEKKIAKFGRLARGGRRLGGKDFNDLLFDWVVKKFYDDFKIDLKDEWLGAKLFGDQSFYSQTLHEIREKCRIAKESLSSAESTGIHFRLLPGKSINYKIDRRDFETLAADKIRMVRQACENLKQEVESRVGQVVPERIYLVGGASQMPFVAKIIQEVFSKKPLRSIRDLQGPTFCVAAGAAKFAETGVAATISTLAKGEAGVQIFLSYAREDEQKVRSVYEQLVDAGFSPWMDKKKLLFGDAWKTEIQKAMQSSHFFIAFLSSHSSKRQGFFEKEIEAALDIWLKKSGNDFYLIPVRLQDCEVPERLREFHYADLFGENEKLAWLHLINSIKVRVERLQKPH